MEELLLTDPVVEPAKTTNKFKVISILFDLEGTNTMPTPGMPTSALVRLRLKDNYDKSYNYEYTGQVALDMIKFMNTANFTNKSMHKRILERLSADGVLPGTVQGAPDAAVGTAMGGRDADAS